MGIHDTVKTMNATVRTMIAAVVVAAAGFFGYQGYEFYNEPQSKLDEANRELETARASYREAQNQLGVKQQQIVALNSELDEANEQVERLDMVLKLLKVDRRLAELRVIDQQESAETGEIVTRVSFVETNEEGHPIGQPRQFDIPGEKIYVDYLVAKFEDHYIEDADLDRDVAICVFQSIFGEDQQPNEGYTLDNVGTRPTAYSRGGQTSEFEQQIWNDFWTIANDPQAADKLGIRAAHGTAVSIQAQPEMVYQIEMRATGDFTLRASEPSEP